MDVIHEPRANKTPIGVYLRHLWVLVHQQVGARYAQDYDAQRRYGQYCTIVSFETLICIVYCIVHFYNIRHNVTHIIT